jgi:hypothetical protein
LVWWNKAPTVCFVSLASALDDFGLLPKRENKTPLGGKKNFTARTKTSDRKKADGKQRRVRYVRVLDEQ